MPQKPLTKKQIAEVKRAVRHDATSAVLQLSAYWSVPANLRHDDAAIEIARAEIKSLSAAIRSGRAIPAVK